MRKGITRRWMVNGFAVIVGFLVIVEIAFMVAVRSYYYQGVETALSNRAETYRNSVSMSVAFSNLSAGTVDLSQRAQELVERFNNKEKMELQVLTPAAMCWSVLRGFSLRRMKSRILRRHCRRSNAMPTMTGACGGGAMPRGRRSPP